ncbi:MAG TPA: hypothetical protein VGK42_06030 [Candidatus Dormibacteraeota bacterium]
MKEDEDLELAALQRQLDDAFETTRPRASFEDELWLKMQSRRPFWARLRDVLTGLVDGVREAPAVPATAVAVLLVVAISIGVIRLSGLGPGGGGGGTSLATREGGDSQFNGQPGPFGRLPAPALQAGVVPVDGQTAPKASSAPGLGSAAIYFGPAKLEWAGQLSVQVTSAPVFRYVEPSMASADQFATSLGASPQAAQREGPGILGSYAGDGFTLSVRASTQAPSGEPFYVLILSTPPSTKGTTAMEIANAYLTAHSLVPAWPKVVAFVQSGDVTRVLYLRQFSVPSLGNAYVIDGLGARYGLEVDIKGGAVQSLAGPLPLNLDSADYPVITAEEAVRSALASSQAGPGTITPTPTVRLTTAELVYALAWAGDHSFYEPAFLFSGTFTYNGTTYVKRILVPAVVPSQRSS